MRQDIICHHGPTPQHLTRGDDNIIHFVLIQRNVGRLLSEIFASKQAESSVPVCVEASDMWPHALNYSQFAEMIWTCFKELYSVQMHAIRQGGGGAEMNMDGVYLYYFFQFF